MLTRFIPAFLLFTFLALPALAQPDPPQVASPASPTPASRAGDYVHHGFYLRFGIGPSLLKLSGDGPASSATLSGFGPALTLAIGGTIEDGLVVAGLWHVTLGESSPIAGPLGGNGELLAFAEQLGLLVDWYPDPQGGWHVGGAVGIGILGANAVSGGGANLSGIDATASLLGGYDWWVSRKWALGTELVAAAGTRTALDGSVDPGQPSYRFAPASIALEFTVLFN